MFLLAVFLFIVFLTPMIWWLKRGKDIFAPVMVVSLLHILKIIPYLFMVVLNEENLKPLVLSHDSIKDIDTTLFLYILLQMISYFFILLGIKASASFNLTKRLPVIKEKKSLSTYYFIFFFGIAITAYFYFNIVQEIGGFSYLISNLQMRTHLTAGRGYTLKFLDLIFLALVAMIFSLKIKKSYFRVLLVIATICSGVVMYSSFGGRSKSVQLIIIAMLAWHYGYKRFKRIPMKLVFTVIPMVCLYIIAIPIFRTQGMASIYLSNPSILLEHSFENIFKIFGQISFLNHYLIVISHFKIDNLWLGKSFLDLLSAPIPRTIFPNKPPVDDGVYLWNIANGNYVSPPQPYNEMMQSAWPLETFGNMYANFWIPGLFIGMFALGFLYRTAYAYMEKSQFSIFSVILYGNIMLYFQFDNLGLIRGTLDATLFLFFLIPFIKYRSKRKYKNANNFNIELN